MGYWLVLIPVLLLLALGLPAMTAQPQVVTSFFLLEWRLELNVIPVAWSLTFELWFYLCIATLYVSCRRSSTRLLGVLCASLALNLWHGAWAYLATDTWLRDQLPVPFFLSGLALEFLWGALLASALNHFGQTTLSSHRLRAASLACLLVFAGFVAVLALPVERYAVSSLRAWSAGLVGLGLVMLALCANAKDATTCAFVLRAPTPLVALGDASYSLYLLHPVALWLLPFFVGVRAGADAAFSAPVSLLVFAVVCAVSILWYFWLERPAIRAARSLVESKLSWR